MQLVKEYKFIMGDKRFERETKTIVEQINEDLFENKVWTIHSLLVAGDNIIVVYNVEESATIKRTLNEGSINSINSDEINQLQYADKYQRL